MKVTAIIINYFTAQFLSPLLAVLNAEPGIDKIVIADNSNETGLKKIAKNFTKVRLLTLKKNIGFGAAVNRAAKKYKTDYYLLINPDTLPDVGFVEKLIAGAEKTNALMAGPRFYWDDKKTFRLPPALGYSWGIQNAMQAANHAVADAKLLSFDWSIRHERFWRETEAFCEPFLSGACLLIKNDKSFFKDGEIFDERFFLYYEDTDLCMKALLQNRPIVCVPDAEVVHYWDQSPAEGKGRLMAESHRKFFEKYYGSIRENKPQFVNQKGIVTSQLDIGEFSVPPIFRNQTTNQTEVNNFDLGLNPFFVPFAQTELCLDNYKIPGALWNNLKPGVYFSRIRNHLNQTLTQWKWKKL